VCCGPGSAVGIATGYELDGPDRPWGPPSLLFNAYRVFPGGKVRPGRDADPSPPSSAVGHERVELYLYSLYGPQCLYKGDLYRYLCLLLYVVGICRNFGDWNDPVSVLNCKLQLKCDFTR